MLLATDSRYLAAHKLSLADIKGLVPVSGFFWVDKPGVAPDRPQYVWGTNQKVWIESSPSRYLRADLPPVLLIDTDGDEEVETAAEPAWPRRSVPPVTRMSPCTRSGAART